MDRRLPTAEEKSIAALRRRAWIWLGVGVLAGILLALQLMVGATTRALIVGGGCVSCGMALHARAWWLAKQIRKDSDDRAGR